MVLAKCQCGKESNLSLYKLSSGGKSCGCHTRRKPSPLQIGSRYGMLTLAEDLGRSEHLGFRRRFAVFNCDCGRTKKFDVSSVKGGYVKSCGCNQHGHGGKRRTVFVKDGDIFGNLLVIDARIKRGSRKVLVYCSCGSELLVSVHSLVRGYQKSCGCFTRSSTKKRIADKRIPLTGKCFGKLTVLSEAGVKNLKRAVICECACGVKKQIIAADLINGRRKSCGCEQLSGIRKFSKSIRLSPEQLKFKKFRTAISILLWHNFKRVGSSKLKVGTFKILGYDKCKLREHLMKFVGKVCLYCKETTVTLTNGSIDHIIPSSLARTRDDVIRLSQLDNLRLICLPCNLKKNDSFQGDLFIQNDLSGTGS